jgi:predicted SAM-dependent methyltransferase
MKLNIGAGGIEIQDFVSCDYDPLAKPDYCFDLERDIFPFDDNTVEVVLAHHVLEHLGEGYFHCLKEIYRVCKPGALVHIRVPHHRHDHFHDDPTHRRPITVGGLRLFSKKYNKLCREQKAASSRLGDYFDVDFEILEHFYSPTQVFRLETEGQPSEQVEKYILEHANVLEELTVKLLVVK